MTEGHSPPWVKKSQKNKALKGRNKNPSRKISATFLKNGRAQNKFVIARSSVCFAKAKQTATKQSMFSLNQNLMFGENGLLRHATKLLCNLVAVPRNDGRGSGF
jgi:hypothetical protein